MAIIYVFTNPAFEDNYVRVGRVADMRQLSREMNGSGLPLPFRCVLAIEVQNDAKVERLLRQAFAEHLTGAASEYFNIDPKRLVAALKLTGGRELTPGSDASAGSVHRMAPTSTKRARRRNSDFTAAGLNIGDTIYFSKDCQATAQVVSSNRIKFEGAVTSVSASAKILLVRAGYEWQASNGWKYWMYDGETLFARIKRMEAQPRRKDS